MMLASTEHFMHCLLPLNKLYECQQRCVHEFLTQGGKSPDSVAMVLSVEISDFLASFSSQAVQEGISWVVHHLGKCPQRVGNVASTELFCMLHCSTVPV